MKIQSLIVLTGPTGVGKTALTLDIAQHYGIEIINADSRQIYKELQIGTAAPTKAQLERVKHHLLRVKTLTIITLQVFTSKMY